MNRIAVARQHVSDGSRRRSPSPRGLLTGLAVALLLVLAPASAHAATVVYQDSSRGLSVSAHGSTEDGCISTSTTFDASATRALYSAYTSDACTGESTAVLGWATPTTFSVRGNLATAHVVATIPLTDADTGQPAGQILVDDTWTATQQASKGKYSYTTNTPGEYRYSSRSTGTFAPAVVTGTVPFDDGSLGNIASREISITHV